MTVFDRKLKNDFAANKYFNRTVSIYITKI